MTDDAYRSLADSTDHDDPRWAFGSGFEDVEDEITAPVPDGVDPSDLTDYALMLGDDALVLSHRLAAWVAHAPELEEEVALANVALDLLGQARALLARAGHVEGRGRDEDALAYLRTEVEYRCVGLVELADAGDFALAVARLLVFSTWRLELLAGLTASTDPVLAAVAAKGVKEVAYHRDHATRWTVRLGDGTDLSHRRMQAAVDAVWPYLDELWRTSGVEARLVDAGVAVDPDTLAGPVLRHLDRVLAAATLTVPDLPGRGGVGGRAGRQGVHTEMLGPILAELQSLARQHPGATW